MEDQESSNVWVGPLTIWSSWLWEVIISSLDPLAVVLSSLWYLYDLALKSPITMVRYRFLLKIQDAIQDF